MIGVEDGVLWDLQAKKAIIINWVLREIQVKETKEYLGEKIYDCSPPGSAVSGILQARTLKWAAISFSRA